MRNLFFPVLLFLSVSAYSQSAFKVSVGPEAKSTNPLFHQVEYLGNDNLNYYVLKNYWEKNCAITINVFDKKSDALMSTIELDGFKSIVKPAYYSLNLFDVEVLKNTIWVIANVSELRKGRSKQCLVVYDKITGKPLTEVIDLGNIKRIKATSNNEVNITIIEKTATGSKTKQITYDEMAKPVNTIELDKYAAPLYDDGFFYSMNITSGLNDITVSRINPSTKESAEKKITALTNKTIFPDIEIKGDFIYISSLYKDGIDKTNKRNEFDGFAVVKLNKTTLETVYESTVPFDQHAKTMTLGRNYKEKDKIGGLQSSRSYIKDNGNIILTSEVVWSSEYDADGSSTRSSLILMEFGPKGERVWSQCIGKSHIVKSYNENEPLISLSGNTLLICFLDRADNQIKNLKEYYSPKTMNQHAVAQKTDIAPFVHRIDEKGEITREMVLVKTDKSYALLPLGFLFDDRFNYYLVDGKNFRIVNISYSK